MARMSLDTAIRLSAEVKGGGNIDRVKRSLQELAQSSQVSARDMATLRSATFQFARANDNTVAGIRNSIAAFRGLQEQAQIGSREFQAYGNEIEKLERKLKGLDNAAGQANPALNGLAASARNLIAAYAGIETLRFVFAKTAELETQTRSLQVLTGSVDKAKQIIQELQQLGAVTPFTSTELIETAKRLQAFGVETNKVVDITSRLADVAGATGANLGELATAYGQVQAKGRLQGEELLQFQERGVALQQVLKKEYNLTGEQFQKALEKGQISAEAVEYALIKLTSAGGKYANGAIAQSDTLAGRFSTLTDGVEQLAKTIGTALSPAIKAVLNEAIFAINQINKLIATGARAKSFGMSESQRRQLLNQASNEAEQIVNKRNIQDPFERNRVFQEIKAQRERDLIESYGYRTGQIKPAVTIPQAPSNLPPLSGGSTGGSTGGSGGGNKNDFQPSSRARALMAAADKLGISALDLATIISFETGGTFSPSKMGGAGGNYMGLIQFGPNERKTYGARPNQSFEEQVTGPVVRYFQDRFGKVGMSTQGASLLDLYTTVLAGNPRANRNARDSFGTSPISGVQRMGPHRQKALSTFFGGSMANVEVDPLKRAESANQAYEQINQQRQAAEDLLKTEQNRLRVLESSDPLQRQVTEALIKQSDIQDEYARKLAESRSPEERRALKLARENALRVSSIELERSLTEATKAATDPLNEAIKSAADKLAFEREYGELIAQGVNPELARQFVELDRIAAKSKENLELQIQMLEAKAAELPVTSEIRKELERQIELRKQHLKLISGATDQAKKDTTDDQKKRNERERREQDAKEAAERAKQLYRGIVNTIEDGIVASIQAGIDSLIDGTKQLDQALQEIAAGVLKEISNQLLRFAINAGMRAIFPSAFADGGVFTSGGVQAFASGGAFSNSIVSSPTMFKFANGGAMKTGLMGEAGPEAIMPLRRGPDGRLGVDASGLAVPFQRPTATADGAELAVPFQRTAAGLQVPFMKDAAAAESAAAGGPATIDVRFETVRIGNLDVVTREEAQRIGRESAQRGAELAHKRYRNNPSARRAVGMA